MGNDHKKALMLSAGPVEVQLPERCCGRCAYSRGMLHYPDIPPNHRICRRYPPQVTAMVIPAPDRQGRMVPQVVNNAAFPQVEDTYDCGEFRPINTN